MGKEISASIMKITYCDGALCDSPFQDARYGGKRVFNPMPLTDGGVGYRCTVCSKATLSKGGPASVRRAAQRHALQVGYKILLARVNAGNRSVYTSQRKGYK